jgi:hypothetical protein
MRQAAKNRFQNDWRPAGTVSRRRFATIRLVLILKEVASARACSRRVGDAPRDPSDHQGDHQHRRPCADRVAERVGEYEAGEEDGDESERAREAEQHAPAQPAREGARARARRRRSPVSSATPKPSSSAPAAIGQVGGGRIGAA